MTYINIAHINQVQCVVHMMVLGIHSWANVKQHNLEINKSPNCNGIHFNRQLSAVQLRDLLPSSEESHYVKLHHLQ